MAAARALWLFAAPLVTSGFLVPHGRESFYRFRASDDDAAPAAPSAPAVAGTSEAIELWRKSYGNPYNRLKDPVTGEQTVEPDEEIAARFAALAELVGPEKAFTIVKNSNGRVISMEPELVKGYVDAWVARAGERALALDILCKNPNLIAGDVNEIKNAPVQVALGIANAIDFTRKLSGG